MPDVALECAMYWVNGDPAAAIDDVKRLGIDEAASYNMDLVAERIGGGDNRWREITPDAMRDALLLLCEGQET